MNIEEATDILKNIIADEVIGTYCVEIQKEGINCSENCKDEDCYLIQAIEVVLSELDKYEKQLDLDYVENNYVRKEIIQHELDKKDKIINEMAEMLEKDHEWFYSEFDNYTKQDFIDYFKKKVSE